MEHHHPTHGLRLLLGCAIACALGACGEDEVSASAAALLTAECESPADIPDNAWVCPADRVLECGADDVVFVADDETTSCAGEDVVLSEDGPFAPGEHTITISDDEGDELCTAELTVVDTEAPEIEQHTIQLWPPNHKFHEIAVEDCVSATDACDGELQGELIWASSDEPVDDLGDGHHAPDIGVSADRQTACVRAERQGPKDGRVYKLGVRVVDDAGNETLGECAVIVDHDRRGVIGADSGEAYRVAFDGSGQLAPCGAPGEEPPPDEPDAGISDAGRPDAAAPDATVPLEDVE